jgi:hypothetical protein
MPIPSQNQIQKFKGISCLPSVPIVIASLSKLLSAHIYPSSKAPAPNTDCIEHQPDQANVFTPRLDRFRQVELSKYEPERCSPAGNCSRDDSCMDSLYCANETTVLGQQYVLAFPPDWADSNLCRHRSSNERGSVFTPYLWLVHILLRQSYSVHYADNDLILKVDTGGSKHGGIHMA